MADVKLWQIFVSLGVPGLALGVLYMLFRHFRWQFPRVRQVWVGPIIVLFLLLVSGIILTALVLWSPTRNSADNGDVDPKPLTSPRDRTNAYPSDIREIPGLAVQQVLEGKSFDTSSRVFEIEFTNHGTSQIFLRKVKVLYQYQPGDEPISVDKGLSATFVAQSTSVVKMPIDINNHLRRKAEMAIHPAFVVPAMTSNVPGRATFRVQLQYVFENNQTHHRSIPWNIDFDLLILDEAQQNIAIFENCKWPDPDPVR